MGDIVNKVRNNLKHTPNHRIGDINILYLARVVEDLKGQINNGLTNKIDKIWQKLSTLPCAVHNEKIKNLNEKFEYKTEDIEKVISKPSASKTLIAWLFVLYGTNLFGVVLIAFKLFTNK